MVVVVVVVGGGGLGSSLPAARRRSPGSEVAPRDDSAGLCFGNAVLGRADRPLARLLASFCSPGAQPSSGFPPPPRCWGWLRFCGDPKVVSEMQLLTWVLGGQSLASPSNLPYLEIKGKQRVPETEVLSSNLDVLV